MPKICSVDGCDHRVWGKGYCARHQYLRADKKIKPVKPYSDKRRELNKLYDAEARQYRKQNPECAIKSPNCTKHTQGVHHKKGRGKYLLEKATWLPACNPCNHYVEAHHQWAIDNGFKERRHII